MKLIIFIMSFLSFVLQAEARRVFCESYRQVNDQLVYEGSVRFDASWNLKESLVWTEINYFDRGGPGTLSDLIKDSGRGIRLFGSFYSYNMGWSCKFNEAFPETHGDDGFTLFCENLQNESSTLVTRSYSKTDRGGHISFTKIKYGQKIQHSFLNLKNCKH